MSTETPRDPSTYTGANIEIGLQEAKNLKISDILGLGDEPVKTSQPKPTVHEVVQEIHDEPEDTVDNTDIEVDPDDNPWANDNTDSNDNSNENDSEDEIELKSDDVDYLKQKAINEGWKAKRIEKELKKVKEELEKYRSGTNIPTPKQEESQKQSIQINPEIPQHIKAKIKDNIDHIIFSDPEMIELANREALIKASIDKYETVGAYAEALTEVQTEFKAKHLSARQYIQQHNEQVRQQENSNVAKILENFTSKVNAAKDQYPHIEKAVDYLNKNADKLHIEVRRALLTDDNAGELAWLLGSSKKAMDLLIKSSESAAKNKTIPTDALMYIGELKGRIRNNTISENREPVESTVRKPAVPKVIKNSPVNSKDTPDDLMKWGKQAREGKVKLPWQ